MQITKRFLGFFGGIFLGDFSDFLGGFLVFLGIFFTSVQYFVDLFTPRILLLIKTLALTRLGPNWVQFVVFGYGMRQVSGT